MGNIMNMMKEMGKMDGGALGNMMKMFKKWIKILNWNSYWEMTKK